MLFTTISFADVGPSPDPPSLVVTFTKNNQIYDGEINLNYVCNIAPTNDGSPVGEREVVFSCTAGLCTNEYWFYKFNPCFDSGDGYFKYQEAGKEYAQTEDISFGNNGARFEINLDTGEIKQFPNDNGPDNLTCCGTPALILLLLIGILMRN